MQAQDLRNVVDADDVPEVVKNAINRLNAAIRDGYGAGLSFADNILCEPIVGTFGHGIPQTISLRRLRVAKSALCPTPGVRSVDVFSSGKPGTCQVVVCFHDSTATKGEALLFLLPDGPGADTQPSGAVDVITTTSSPATCSATWQAPAGAPTYASDYAYSSLVSASPGQAFVSVVGANVAGASRKATVDFSEVATGGTSETTDWSVGLLGATNEFVILDSVTNARVLQVDTGDQIRFGVGVAGDGGGFKHKRVTTGVVAGGARADVTVTWGTAFANANYTSSVSVVETSAAGAGMRVERIRTQLAGSIVAQVMNDSGGNLTGTLHAIAIHD